MYFEEYFAISGDEVWQRYEAHVRVYKTDLNGRCMGTQSMPKSADNPGCHAFIT